MRIKVCGITNSEDGLAAAKLGAWALGFIFFPKSPRYLDPKKAKEIVKGIRDKMANPPLMVGVFVNESQQKLKEIKRHVGLDFIQLHGDEEIDYAAQLDSVILARRPNTATDLDHIKAFKQSINYLLVDASIDGEYGGTGHRADWQLAKQARNIGIPLILAGGINPENIRQAWREVQPFAIDLSSGVELKPGKKSLQKLQKLFSN